MLPDLYGSINGALSSHRGSAQVRTSKGSLGLLQLLQREGLIGGFHYNGNYTKVFLKYRASGQPTMKHLLSISRPGREVHVSAKVLSQLAHTNELFLISTHRGILTLREALAAGVGGKVLCKVL